MQLNQHCSTPHPSAQSTRTGAPRITCTPDQPVKLQNKKSLNGHEIKFSTTNPDETFNNKLRDLNQRYFT